MRFILIFMLLWPVSFLLGQNYDIYVSDAGGFNTGPWQILKFDQNGENGEVFIPHSQGNLAWPQDIVFLGDSVVLVSNLSNGRITKHQQEDGTFIEDFANGINGPTRMKIGADGLLYVLEWGNNGQVKRYQLDGTFVDNFTDVGVTQGIGLDWDSEGNLYVSSWSGGSVRKFNADGQDQGIFTTSNLNGPTNIWFDDNGDLIALNWSGGNAVRFNSEGVFQDVFIPGLSNPEGITVLPNGNMLIGNGGTSEVKLYDAQGNFIENVVESGALDLLFPNAVVIKETVVSNTVYPSIASIKVYPTLGTTFYIDDQDVDRIEHIQVFNHHGQLVASRPVTSNRIWQADQVPAGLYILSVKLKTGSVAQQQVVVR